MNVLLKTRLKVNNLMACTSSGWHLFLSRGIAGEAFVKLKLRDMTANYVSSLTEGQVLLGKKDSNLRLQAI